MFEKKYVLILLAFFLHLLPHMLKIATGYFNFCRRHWLFTMLVMCAATGNVLGNVDPLIQYIHGLHRYLVQYNKKPFKLLCLCDSVHSLSKARSFVFFCNETDCSRVAEIWDQGADQFYYLNSVDFSIQLTSPIQFTS